MTKLSLFDAIKSGRLREFALQEETRGIGPVDEGELMAALGTTIKHLRSEDQTSRSPSRDDLPEK